MSEYNHQYVSNFFQRYSLPEADRKYIDFHKYRFAFVLNQIKISQEREDLSVLDIGPSFLTNLVSETFSEFQMETLGLHNSLVNKKDEIGHFYQDLNFIGESDELPKSKYDLVLFAEVLEHLYTDPRVILKGIHKLMKPGATLLLQTPNAVSIDKRIKMITGKNPYQFIIPNRQNHFREYTGKELRDYLNLSGFRVLRLYYSNYFNPNTSPTHRFFRKSGPYIPPSWRDGITIICQAII
ncbi:MAG: class I SAM-dependent methyltransferase [Saprospiraceae bacterium]|nr:class I SAM-dependent methyltransferase [Saprospiraceae bacterium]